MISHKVRFVALMASAAVAVATPAMAAAQDVSSAAWKQSFNIPAQDLGKALTDLARQSNREIYFASDLTRGKRSPALSSEMTLDQALQRLLAGSGLTYRLGSSGAIIIRSAVGNGAGELRGLYGGGDPALQRIDDDRKEENEEIVVTGSHIRGTAPAGANIIVLDREDLDSTGRSTLAEAIQTLPQVHGGGTNTATMRTGEGAAPNAFGNTGALGGASLNLRGLGVEETLTLVNGRRLAPAGGYGAFADISALPLAAVKRVEILADGASATYGADAMAGVVNIIMDRHFEGAETRLRAGLETRSGQPELRASQTFGWAFDRGSVLLSADYARQDGVTAKGRPYAASADLRPLGGGDWRSSACSPGNIASPADLAGAIPAGQDGTTLTPDQILRGETNRCDIYDKSSYLIPKSEKGSVYLATSYDVNDQIQLSANLIASHQKTTTIGSNYPAFFLAVPTSNAYRLLNGLHGGSAPLNQPIFLNYLFTEAGPTESTNDVWSLLGSIGLDYRLGGDWELSFYGSYGRYDSNNRTLTLDRRSASDGGALNQALASSDLETAFNPFGDGTTNGRKLVEGFFSPYHILQESNYRSVGLSLDGSLLDLPGGDLKLAVGGDYRRERFGTRARSYYANLAPRFQESGLLEAGRVVSAAYAELLIPLFSERNAVAGAKRLSISLSGRYDHYSDFGGTFNPKIGVTWEPVPGLSLKGSYGSSFKAPLFSSLYYESQAYVAFLSGAAGAPDINGDGFINTIVVAGGNPDLGPEKGKSWTAGLEIRPAALPNLRLHATYFNLRFTGRFAQTNDSSRVFADPRAYEGIAYFPLPSESEINNLLASIDRVDGGIPPAGSVEAIIDMRTMNFASQVLDGVDAGASYSWDALGGTFNLSTDVSYLSRYKSRLGQSATATSYLANVGLPSRWKMRGRLGWTGGGISLSGWVNHTAGYSNKLVEPHEPVSSYTTVDLSSQVQLSDWAGGIVGKETSLSFYVTNLFDQAPPFVNNRLGVAYDGANADPIGRRIAVQLTKRW